MRRFGTPVALLYLLSILAIGLHAHAREAAREACTIPLAAHQTTLAADDTPTGWAQIATHCLLCEGPRTTCTPPTRQPGGNATSARRLPTPGAPAHDPGTRLLPNAERGPPAA